MLCVWSDVGVEALTLTGDAGSRSDAGSTAIPGMHVLGTPLLVYQREVIPRPQKMANNLQRQGRSARLVERRSYCTEKLLAGGKFADAHSSRSGPAAGAGPLLSAKHFGKHSLV
mgnify:CR=1 FL=1